MALTKEKKQQIIADYARKPQDTGSCEVQVSLLTERIQYLVEHLKAHKKDVHSKRGLLNLISQRKKLLAYLRKQSFARYKDLIGRLGLRK